MEPISKRQFTLYRVLFGLYMTIHFMQVLPDSEEVFSSGGMIKQVQNLPAYGKLPIFLFKYDEPITVNLYMLSLIIASIMLTFGYYRKIVSVWLFYGWVSLFNRNVFISNPGLAYIGWILLSFVCIPDESDPKWKFPYELFAGMWVIAPMSYTVSGIDKLKCPSWIDGTALHHVLTSVLTRDNFLVHMILALPDSFIKIMTWQSLFGEISFLFLGMFKHLRKTYWFFFLFFHIGILMTVNFGDLTLGMLVAHLYMFDGRWFRGLPQTMLENISSNECPINRPARSDSVEEEKLDTNKWIGRALLFSILVGVIAIYINSDILDKSETIFGRFNKLTINSLWGFCYLTIGLFVLMALERIFPDQKLKEVPGWWKWVVGINLFQLFAVVLATFTWEKWLRQTSYFTSTTGFHLRDHVSPFVGGLIAYIINQWIFYWWHYMRHHIYVLWILFHQFHHSPKRIEAVTSFYKHPFEIIVDSQIMAALLYSVLGLTEESSIWLSIFSGFGEYFYHMNIRTPQIIGYFFQRPESHRCHHLQNKRDTENFSDFPLWDLLNGTFKNPARMDDPTGFSGDSETMRVDMLLFKDVLRHFKTKHIWRTTLYYLLVLWGLTNSFAFLTHIPITRQVSSTVSSPLPLVFGSYNGVETFSTTFTINATLENSVLYKPLDLEMYSNIGGSYNRRNTYGAIFAYGPFFTDPSLIALRQEILYYGICDPGVLTRELGINDKVKELTVFVKSKTKGNNGQWNLNIKC